METITENILDVTVLGTRLKHSTIFSRFDELQEGETLTIHNDHDPKPLYYQMIGERGNVFNWEYLEQGPEWWKVNITKRTIAKQEETLGAIAAKDLRKAQILKKYGLDFCAELTAHMIKEEKVLFPYIKQLVAAKNSAESLPSSHFGTVQNPINMMEVEHEMVGKNLAEIRDITFNYKLPQDACASYSLLYRMLNEFEEDMHLHIHLENNILFPKALEVEKQLSK